MTGDFTSENYILIFIYIFSHKKNLFQTHSSINDSRT